MMFPYLRVEGAQRTACSLSKHNSSHWYELTLTIKVSHLYQDIISEYIEPIQPPWFNWRSGTVRWNSSWNNNFRRCNFIKAGWPLLLLLTLLCGIIFQWFSSLSCKPPFSFHLPSCVYIYKYRIIKRTQISPQGISLHAGPNENTRRTRYSKCYTAVCKSMHSLPFSGYLIKKKRYKS